MGNSRDPDTKKTLSCCSKYEAISGAIIGVLAFLIVVCLVILFFLVMRNRRMKRKREDNEGITLDAKTDFGPRENENLKGNLNEITDNVDKLYEDFRNIETLAKEEALKETIAIAYKEDNLAHNRYADIGQYI